MYTARAAWMRRLGENAIWLTAQLRGILIRVMMIRDPVVAGRFYPEDPDKCRRVIGTCIDEAAPTPNLPGQVVGGVVPHAGWVCSGRVAAGVFNAIKNENAPDVIVLFGTAHRPCGPVAPLFPSGQWESPLGPITIDDRLAYRVMSHTNLVAEDPYAHESEHSIEVQIPFIQTLFPDAKLLPILIPMTANAPEIGQAVGRTLISYCYNAIVLASSDLTHYGPRYNFTPKGIGEAGLLWAREVNDKRLIDHILALDELSIVPEALQHKNACGAGAISAAIAAAKQLSANNAVLLEHATSQETLGQSATDDAVGYAGIVFTRPN